MNEIDNFFTEKEEPKAGIAKLTPKDRVKTYRLKQMEKNPNWDRERAKKWRTEHRENYLYGQARFFFNKLTAEQRKRLLDESHMPVLP